MNKETDGQASVSTDAATSGGEALLMALLVFALVIVVGMYAWGVQTEESTPKELPVMKERFSPHRHDM